MPDFDELLRRIEALEGDADRLRAAAQGTTPMGKAPPAAYQADPSRVPEIIPPSRAEQEAQDQAHLEFSNSPSDQKITQLEREVAELRQHINRLHGRGGIVVTGTVIDFIPAQARVATLDDAASSLTVLDEGGIVTEGASSLDFVGAGVTATAAGAVATITIPGDTTSATNAVAASSTIAEVLVTGTNVEARSLEEGKGINFTQAVDRITIDTTIAALDEASPLTSSMISLAFVGAGVTATAAGDLVTATIPGDTTVAANSGSGAAVLKTGTNVTARKLAEGTGITITEGTDEITIAVDGGTFSPMIAIEEEGSEITDAVERINFVGETITATAAGNDVTVTMSELTFSFCVDGSAVDFIVAAVEAP